MKKFKISEKTQLEAEIELNDLEQKIITLDYLYDKFDWGPDYTIKYGTVFCSENLHKKKLRTATSLDIHIDKVIKSLI